MNTDGFDKTLKCNSEKRESVFLLNKLTKNLWNMSAASLSNAQTCYFSGYLTSRSLQDTTREDNILTTTDVKFCTSVKFSRKDVIITQGSRSRLDTSISKNASKGIYMKGFYLLIYLMALRTQ